MLGVAQQLNEDSLKIWSSHEPIIVWMVNSGHDWGIKTNFQDLQVHTQIRPVSVTDWPP